MSKLKDLRLSLSLSARALVHSLGEGAISVRRYNQIEQGVKKPTGYERDMIRICINVNRRELGLDPVTLEDLGLEL